MSSNNSNTNTNTNNNAGNQYIGRRRRREEAVQPPVNQVQRQVHNNRRGNEEFRGDGVVSEEEISENYTEKSLLEAEPVNFCPLPSSGVSVLLTGAEFNHMRNEIIALKRENERLREISEENRKLKE
jgi:hypothetical protein